MKIVYGYASFMYEFVMSLSYTLLFRPYCFDRFLCLSITMTSCIFMEKKRKQMAEWEECLYYFDFRLKM